MPPLDFFISLSAFFAIVKAYPFHLLISAKIMELSAFFEEEPHFPLQEFHFSCIIER